MLNTIAHAYPPNSLTDTQAYVKENNSPPISLNRHNSTFLEHDNLACSFSFSSASPKRLACFPNRYHIIKNCTRKRTPAISGEKYSPAPNEKNHIIVINHLPPRLPSRPCFTTSAPSLFRPRRCLPGKSTSGCTTRICLVKASLRENVFSSVHR